MALSYKGHLAWMRGDAHEVVALSRAALRDGRVFVAQRAYNLHQQARGRAMAGDVAEVDRTLGRAADTAETAVARQAEAPEGMYWYGAGFFTLQRGLTWHTVRDNRYATRAAGELTSGLGELPDGERDSEWAAIFTVAAAESYPTPVTPSGPPARRGGLRPCAERPVPHGSRRRCAASTLTAGDLADGAGRARAGGRGAHTGPRPIARTRRCRWSRGGSMTRRLRYSAFRRISAHATGHGASQRQARPEQSIQMSGSGRTGLATRRNA
ncbi:MAG: hypothetical protein M3R63_25415 [Actinomycetota bacterium]|nr:hypothetical protein [Actinomycetota bacterium]